MSAPDFLDEIIEASTAENPDFPRLVEAAQQRRRLLRSLGDMRRSLRMSQTAVAAKMATSQSQLGRLEAGEADPRLSTIERYAAALGKRIEWDLADADKPNETRPANRSRVAS
jgi:ribosome-binding protein aMBF1 (putative translation factor)